MDFLPTELLEYVEAHSQVENEFLGRINRETHLEVLKPRMLSGHLQGRVLSMLSKMIQPIEILEIGTYTGYSTLCLAEGLDPMGKITTIDINSELESRVRNYFKDSKFNEQINFVVGNAIEIIPLLDHTWDLVFIDADKENYLNYFNLIKDKVKTGGFIVADNVLWSGKVLNYKKNDIDTQAIVEFNRTIQQDPDVENVLFPIRDGLMVIRKII